MGEQKAWKSKDGTVFVEREDGGREIIRDVGGERKLYQTDTGKEAGQDADFEDSDADDE